VEGRRWKNGDMTKEGGGGRKTGRKKKGEKTTASL